MRISDGNSDVCSSDLPAAIIAGDEASPSDIEAVRRTLGLDRPIWEQFGIYVTNLLSGDLGTSIFTSLPVLTLVKQRLEPTVVLAVSTLVVAVTLAVPLGVEIGRASCRERGCQYV